MYKNQLQELAQRSCFNLPSYACIREGPDHAPRFKATVNFNGEMFECPAFFSTLRLAEHAAAEVALNTLSKRGPSRTLAAKVLDETGVYKNLLQETAHRAGLDLPVYTTVRSGPGHVPVFSCTVELGGMSFTGELAKTKKQAQKNAAMSAWGNLKEMSQSGSSSSLTNSKCLEEQEQIIVARFLASQNIANSSNLPKSMQKGHPRPSTTVKGSLSPTSGSVDSYYQNWASSNLSQEMAMHRIWQEEYQRRLIAHGFPFLPVPPPRQVVPWMHPALQPSNYPRCFTTDQQLFSATPGISIVSSPLCFSDQLVPGPIETRFMVTIQDTQRDNPEDSCKLSPPEVPVISNNSDFAVDEKLKDEGKENRCASTGLQPGEAQLQNSIGVESSRPSTDMSRAPSSYPENIRVALPVASPAAPVVYNQGNFRPPYSAPRMRSGINSFLRRPMLGRMQARSFHTPYMAPAVQIRSVVPVCSAAPPRKMASSCLQRPTTDNVRNEATGDNVSRISSNLENLHV